MTSTTLHYLTLFYLIFTLLFIFSPGLRARRAKDDEHERRGEAGGAHAAVRLRGALLRGLAARAHRRLPWHVRGGPAGHVEGKFYVSSPAFLL